jgi:hypothetical protein
MSTPHHSRPIPARDDACRACWVQCGFVLFFLALGWPLAALFAVGLTFVSRSHVDCLDLAAEAEGERGRWPR